jgi:hypothetical protein
MSSDKINEWSEEEKQQLIEFFPTMGAGYCSKIIGRSKRGCQEKAKNLNLKRIFKFQDEEKLKNVIKESKTYTEVILKMGLSSRCSGNFQTLKKYIKKFEIDISHFTRGEFQISNIPSNKMDLENILVVNSSFSRNSLKKRLYNEGLKKKECEICGMGEDWFNGLKIVHILDHINGVSDDNRIENLRIVCPNCNSTLETHSGKNRNKKIYDSEKNEYKSDKTHKKCNCGKVILIGSKMCTKCMGESKRKFERPDLETLLKDVGELGYKGAGKKYGISDNGFRKWIKSYQKEVV